MRLYLILLALLVPFTAGAQGLPKWTATRELYIDGASRLLAQVGTIRVDTGGRIFVLQAQDRQIRVFSDTGAPLLILGRKGRGPGEFDEISNMGLRGDTLWVSDFNLRITNFSTSGKLLGMSKYEFVKARNSRGRFQPVIRAVLADGSMIAEAGQDPPGAAERPMYVLRASAKGDVMRVYGLRPVSNGAFSFSAYGRTGWNLSATTNPPIVSTTQDGSRVAFAIASLSGENAGTMQLTMLTANNDTVYSKRLHIAMEPIPERVVDSAWAAMAKWPDAEVLMRNMVRPQFYPPLEYLRIARDGSVLLAFYTDGAERDFMVLNPQGQPVATVRLPKSVSVMQFEGQLVWGVDRNSNNVDSVVRYRFRPE